MNNRFTIGALLASFFIVFGFVSQASAQPVRTIAVGLAGYSPVSYLENRAAEPGSPEFSAEHGGVTYFFTSESQRRAFERQPERYLPAYGGYCAFGCSVESEFVPDPTSFEIIDGRTHLFLKNKDVDARALWNEADQREVRAKADAWWSSRGASRASFGAQNVGADGIGIQGFSPVSYFTEGRAVRGEARFAAEHDGVTYYLASARELEMFTASPEKYAPQCGGWCAFGMSIEDKFPVDPTTFRVIDGKLYLFLNNEEVDASRLWDEGDARAQIQAAEKHWNATAN